MDAASAMEASAARRDVAASEPRGASEADASSRCTALVLIAMLRR